MIERTSKLMLSIILCLVFLVPFQLVTSTAITNHKNRIVLSKQKNTEAQKIRVLEMVYEYHESPCPKEMAKSVIKTKRPALYASLSIEESDGDPNAIGDGGKSIGAFQIQPQHWGPVPKCAIKQALKAQEILEGHINSTKGDLRKSLAMYNGGDKPPKISYVYADRILARANKINKLMKQKV